MAQDPAGESDGAADSEPSAEIVRARLDATVPNLAEGALQAPFWSLLTTIAFAALPSLGPGPEPALAVWCAAHWAAALALYALARRYLAGRPPPFGASWTAVLSAGAAVLGGAWGAMTWVAWEPGNLANHILLMTLTLTAVSSYTLRLSPTPEIFLASTAALAAVAVPRHVLAGDEGAVVAGIALPLFAASFVLAGLRHGRAVGEALRLQIEHGRLARENAAARLAAEAANAAKSAVLANMSHELRTPLNAVVGFAELIASEALGPHADPRYADYGRHIGESGAHLLRMINELIDMAKIEAGRMRIDPEPIEAFVALAAATARFGERAAQVGFDAAPGIELFADKRALKTMLGAAIDFALDHAGPRGKVVAAARRDGDAVLVEIASDGPPASPDRLARLFAPFERIDESYASGHGAGLGLALTRQFARLHGGEAWAGAGPFGGPAIYLRLPDGAASLAPAAAPVPAAVRAA